MENYSKLKLFTSINWNFSIVITKLIVNIILLIVLSRYLSPREFGISQFTLIIFNLIAINIINSIGFSFIKNLDKNNKNFYGNLFYFSFIFIGLIYLIVGFLFYYISPQLWFTNLHLFLIFSLVIRSFSFYEEYHLMKNNNYKKLAFSEFFSLIFSLILSIYLAIMGYSYWSIIIGTGSYYILKSLILIINSSYVHTQLKFEFRLKDISSSFTFFSGSLSNNIFNQVDKIFITFFFSFSDLGFYYRASQIVNIFSGTIGQAIDSVLFRAFSIDKNDTNLEIKSLDFFISFSNLFVLPFAILIFLHTDKIILFLLGEKWMGVIPILKILSPIIYLSQIIKIYEPIIKSSSKIIYRTYLFIFLSIMIGFSIYLFKNLSLTYISYIFLICYFTYYIIYTFLICSIANIRITEYFSFYRKNIFIPMIIFAVNILIVQLDIMLIILLNLTLLFIFINYRSLFLNSHFLNKSLEILRLFKK